MFEIFFENILLVIWLFTFENLLDDADEVFNALELENKGDAVFDAVIDKGTLDSLLCGEGSHINVEKMLVGISKCEEISF